MVASGLRPFKGQHCGEIAVVTGAGVGVSWTPSTATWYHVAVTKSGTTVKFYVNGTQQGTDQTGAFATIFDGTAPFSLGVWEQTGEWIDGKLDEWGVWNVQLSAADITALYNGGTGQSYPFPSGAVASTPVPALALMGVGC